MAPVGFPDFRIIHKAYHQVAADLRDEVLHDVSRIVTGSILAVDDDCMGEGLGMVLQGMGHQLSQACLATARGPRNQQPPWTGAAQLLQGCSACRNLPECFYTVVNLPK